MDNRAIGIFDSGLGGLTSVKALRSLMPNENIIFFGDNGRVPYGEKSAAQIRGMTVQDMDFLRSFNVKAIIAACGTVTTNAQDILDACPVPAFGVVRSAVKEMSAVGGKAPLGIIATEASIRSGAYRRLLGEAIPERELIDIPCPDFVPLIESGHIAPDDPLLREAVKTALAPLREAGIAALLLGCTHYGIIEECIADFLGEGVRLVNAAACAARDVCGIIRERKAEGSGGTLRLFTSGNAGEFTGAASLLLGEELAPASPVPVWEVIEG